MDYEKTKLTKHAAERIKQRRIPEQLIHDAIKNGRRTFLPCRNAIEYKMKNILGIRGANLVVVTDSTGAVITSYVERVLKRKQ